MIFKTLLSRALLPALVVLFGVATTPALADEDGTTLRAYFSIPFGGDRASPDTDPRLGLQMLQGIRQSNSQPIATFASATVLDFAFTKDGLSSGDLMGIDLVQIHKLTTEPQTVGQNVDGGTIIPLVIAGAALGAAILCVADSICDENDPAPVVDKCAYDLTLACRK